MTSRVIREGAGHETPGKFKEIIVSCDQMDCDKSATDTEIKDGGGLKHMGWTTTPVSGTLRHYCPEHKRN